MVVHKINQAPNFFNGKLYKRWQSVIPLYGEKSILATKTNKTGEYVELLITNGGKKKELFKENEKIVDIIDDSGVKRTFAYQKDGELTIGSMTVANVPEKIRPLVMLAKWITKDLKPQKVELKLNPLHPDSFIKIHETDIETSVNRIYEEHITKAVAENFEDVFGQLQPAKITLTTKDGRIKVIDSENSNTAYYTKILNLGSSGNPGNDSLRVIV